MSEAIGNNKNQVFVVKQEDGKIIALKNGRGTMLKLIDGAVGAKNIDLHINKIQPHTGKGLLHYHNVKENVYFILEGGITIRTPAGYYDAGEGEAVLIPPGVKHAVMNPNDKEAHIIEIYSPCIEGDFIEVIE